MHEDGHSENSPPKTTKSIRRERDQGKESQDQEQLFFELLALVTQSLFLLLADAPQAARAAGGDEPDLLTGRSQAVGRGRVPDVLVVTTTEGVLHGVHRHTTDVGPLVALDAVPERRGKWSSEGGEVLLG